MGTPNSNVRLKVLLNHFYGDSDHRQKAYVIIKEVWKTVLELQNHIQKLFRIPGEVYLTVDGCLLPTDEEIGVVNAMDAVTVHPTESTYTTLTDAFALARIRSGAETTPGACTSDISTPGIDVMPHKKRHTETALISEMIAYSKLSPSKSSKWIGDINSFDVGNPVSPETEVKAKKKRKRKKKNALPVISLDITAAQASSNETNSNAQSVQSVSEVKHAGHIRFDDESNPTNFPMSSNLANEVFSLPAKARVIRAIPHTIPMEIRTKSTKQQTEQKLDLSVSASSSSPPPAPTPTTTNIAPTVEEVRKNIANLNLPSVKDALKINDLIAFKIMKLGHNYAPDLSDYIIGLVQAIDHPNIGIKVMAGIDETKEPQGKFSLDADDCEPIVDADDEHQLFYLQQSNILDAKYVSLECECIGKQ